MIVSRLRNPCDSPSKARYACGMPFAASASRNRSGLRRRHDRVVEALQQQHRAGQLGHVFDGGARSTYIVAASGSGPIRPSR